MNLEREFSLSVSFLQARNLAVSKNTPQKTDADTQTMISILSHYLEGHYCMEKHIDADETQDWLRCRMCRKLFHEVCFEQ